MHLLDFHTREEVVEGQLPNISEKQQRGKINSSSGARRWRERHTAAGQAGSTAPLPQSFSSIQQARLPSTLPRCPPHFDNTYWCRRPPGPGRMEITQQAPSVPYLGGSATCGARRTDIVIQLVCFSLETVTLMMAKSKRWRRTWQVVGNSVAQFR